MKKVSIIGLILICILLQGCRSKAVYPFSQPFENIERIEIIEDPPYRFISQNELYYLDAIVTVEREQWSDFISDFKEIPCKKYGFGPPASMISGYAIRIAYSDGGYEYICKYSGLHIKADGDWKYPAYYFDRELFDSFIKTAINEFSQ